MFVHGFDSKNDRRVSRVSVHCGIGKGSIDLYHGATIMIFFHSNQRIVTKIGRRNSLVAFSCNGFVIYCWYNVKRNMAKVVAE